MKLVYNGNTLTGGGSFPDGLPTRPISREEYDALTDEEKEAEVLYLITDEDPTPVEGVTVDAYNTEDGWYVRKWSDGYVEMDYSVTHRVTSVSSNSGVDYYTFFNKDSVPYPVPLTTIGNVFLFLTSPSGMTGAAPVMSSWSSPLTHLGSVAVNCLGSAGSMTKNIDYTIWCRITGRWK